MLLRDLEGFDMIFFENLDKSWNTFAIGLQYSKIKYAYDTFYKKELPQDTYSWHFSLQLQ